MKFLPWMPCFLLLLPTLIGLVGCSESDSTAPVETSQPVEPVEPTTPSEPAEPTAPVETALELEPLPEAAGSDGTYSISQVMQLAHKNKLYRELFGDSVAPAVAERITVLYADLPKQESPKGDAEDWQKRTTALIDAAARVIDGGGDADAVELFKKAVNCNSCHNRHRP